MSKSEEAEKTLISFEKTKSDKSEDASPSPGTDTEPAENIDKIRELIFGGQMQDYEKRFSRLEERMFKEMTVSKSEARENFDSLEKIINKELESLKDQVRTEQHARTESFRNIERQLKDINRSLEDRLLAEENARSESVRDAERQFKDVTRSLRMRLDRLNDDFGRNSKELQQQISEQSQSLRNDIRQRYEETASLIEKVVQELRMTKVDRSALADFFTELGMRINNDKA
ncbi:hypothetical protein [Desulfonema magnum]|nr:hypothetical protein [Desulfonema magnum]